MTRMDIDPMKFACCAPELWAQKWFLLTAGDFSKGEFNTMTVGWGAFGVFLRKPFALAMSRPQRYTFEFLEKYETYTLSAFPEQYREALNLCGSKSGRDCDKIQLAGLTPTASKTVAAPGFAEAELVLECKKIYAQPMEEKFFESCVDVKSFYPAGGFHKMYWGEITAVSGIEKYKDLSK